jgi:hypothetical protein
MSVALNKRPYKTVNHAVKPGVARIVYMVVFQGEKIGDACGNVKVGCERERPPGAV